MNLYSGSKSKENITNIIFLIYFFAFPFPFFLPLFSLPFHFLSNLSIFPLSNLFSPSRLLSLLRPITLSTSIFTSQSNTIFLEQLAFSLISNLGSSAVRLALIAVGYSVRPTNRFVLLSAYARLTFSRIIHPHAFTGCSALILVVLPINPADGVVDLGAYASVTLAWMVNLDMRTRGFTGVPVRRPVDTAHRVRHVCTPADGLATTFANMINLHVLTLGQTAVAVVFSVIATDRRVEQYTDAERFGGGKGWSGL